MNATFNLGGYTLEITDNGALSAADGLGAHAPGNVGLQVTYQPLALANEPADSRTVMQAFVKPSQARAIASAMLSAATEARSA